MNELSFSKRGEALIGQEMFHILDRAQRLEAEGHKVFHLELGEPKKYPPGRIINQTIISLLHTHVGYASSSGLAEFREALAKHFSNKLGIELVTENVIISTANLLISQFLDIVCDPGDTVGFFTPAFPTYIAASRYLTLDMKMIPLESDDGFDLKVSDVDQLFSGSMPKAIIINSANNPTGRVYEQSVLEYLVRKARENDVWILSDETYAMLSYRRQYHSMLNYLSEYGKIVVISSFSKTFSIPGFRIGYLIGVPEVAEKIALSVSTLISCMPIFTQEGAIEGVPILDEFAEKMKAYYQDLSDTCVALLNESRLLQCFIPDSAFYILIDISKLAITDIDFCTRLLNEYHTAATPGSSFGYPTVIRISICGDENDVLEGIRCIVRFAQQFE